MCALLPRRLIAVLQRGRSLRLPRLGWNLRGRLPGGGEAAGWRVQLHGVVFPGVWHRRQSACQCMPSQGEWHAGGCQGRSAAASPAYSTIRPLARPSPLPAAGLAALPHCPPNLPCTALPCFPCCSAPVTAFALNAACWETQTPARTNVPGLLARKPISRLMMARLAVQQGTPPARRVP